MAELLFGFEYIVSVFCSVIALSIKMPDMICFSLLFSFFCVLFLLFLYDWFFIVVLLRTVNSGWQSVDKRRLLMLHDH
ncbi:hypothetical protein ACE13N_005128, partial [Escherichia coli O45:H11]